MTQLEAKRINNIAFLITTVGLRFKYWHEAPVYSRAKTKPKCKLLNPYARGSVPAPSPSRLTMPEVPTAPLGSLAAVCDQWRGPAVLDQPPCRKRSLLAVLCRRMELLGALLF
jgi:hypothetical protein